MEINQVPPDDRKALIAGMSEAQRKRLATYVDAVRDADPTKRDALTNLAADLHEGDPE